MTDLADAQGVSAIVERVDAACDKLGLPRDNAFMNSTLRPRIWPVRWTP